MTVPEKGNAADVTVVIPTYNRAEWLREAISSVLSQSYANLALIVSDNASDDHTPQVVTTFDDPRLVYSRLPRNIGKRPNMDRLIEMAQTEFLVVLGDDDALMPEHLSLAHAALATSPNAGLAHSGCAVVDEGGTVLDPHVRFVKCSGPVTIESGEQFRVRSMRNAWTACFASAMFRRDALLEAGGLRAEDGDIDDFPLMLRISTRWDFVYLNQPLARMRVHRGAASSVTGELTPVGYRSAASFPSLMHDHRQRFLDEAGLPEAETRRLRRMAEASYGRERVHHLSMRANTGDGLWPPMRALGTELRRTPRLALEPLTWRFVAGQLGGRSIRSAARRRIRAT